jgi:uncharacterized membrane protein YdjX (TVP38/TMEM64 family)
LALVVLATCVMAFSPLGDWAWQSLKTHQEELQAWVDAHYLLALVLFFAGYVLVTGLSLPLATVLSLAAGAFFHLWIGILVVSLASTSGATLALLGSRYLFRDAVQRRFGSRLGPINRGITEDGAFYLLTLRLLPVVPFWFVNLSMGLTPLRVRTFWIVSQIGMLPATVVYVNLGTRLGEIETPRRLVSPTVLISFTLIGLLPLLMRMLLRLRRKPKTPTTTS